MQVYVLLFNAGTDNEGIHSLKTEGQDTVLMFENEDDALRFGLLLEAQDFPSPTVEAFDDQDIEEFCQGAGFACTLVPEGTLAVPPESNLEATDWDPEGKPQEEPPIADESRLSQRELDIIRKRLENLL
jgi:hypothetical protein